MEKVVVEWREKRKVIWKKEVYYGEGDGRVELMR